MAVEHRSPVALMHWSREVFPPEELAGTLGATSLGFDVSVFEIFAPLSWGGRLFVVDSLLALPTLAAAAEVRLVCGAPSAVAELVRMDRFPSWVRTVNLGGEAVPPALVAGLAAAAPAARLLNVYGPSEDTVYTTSARLAPGEPVAIGRPVAGTRIHLLDGRGEPVPAGVPGELHTAGEGLARGYLGRPGLTAEKFVPDPFAAEPGARLYRTGDLARRRPDGVLEYLGRIDHQVKVRGFRVELGEIEAALARHPQVREAVVVAREDGDRGKRLVAYVAPRGTASAELRSFLRESLPEFMVPTAFVHLDALPLSANGKVDRKALPDPGAPGAAPSPATAAAPVFRGQAAELLAGLMAEVLGAAQVGPDDDFFALGGHSLLATRLAARASRLLGVELPVGEVFLHPTAASLAARAAEALRQAAPAAGAPPLARGARNGGSPSPSPSAASGSWRRWSRGAPSTTCRGGCASPGRSTPPPSRRRWPGSRAGTSRCARCSAAAGEPVQAVLPAAAAPLALPRIDLAALSATAAAARGGAAGPRGGAGAVRPPAGAGLARRAPAAGAGGARAGPHPPPHRGGRLVARHPALGSRRPLRGGRPPAAPRRSRRSPCSTPTGPSGRTSGRAARRWRSRWPGGASGSPARRSWSCRPTGRAPPRRSSRGGTRPVSLPAALAMELEGLGRREGATPFMVLLAAFQAQLARYTGAPSVPVGSPVANRGRAEVEGVVGFFVNMLVLRTPVDGDPPFRELLARVREVCLGAYDHQDVPFERLVEELRPERLRARNPLFQVAFQLEEPLAAGRLGEAAAAVERLETGTAKFDLMLSLAREPEGIAGVLEYDADLFDPATADRLLGHWRTLAGGDRRRPAGPPLRAAAAHRGRDGADPRLERRDGPLSAAGDDPRPVRRGGPAAARGGGPLGSGRDRDLRRARRPRGPPGGAPAPARRGAGDGGRTLHRAHPPRW